MLILIAQKMQLGSLNGPQNIVGLFQLPFLKKSRKLPKIQKKVLKKTCFGDILVGLLDFLSNGN